MIVLAICVLVFCVQTNGLNENFPSLLSSNATIAIVIDKEYLGNTHSKFKEGIETILIEYKRKYLKHGGINVKYFSWSAINVKRDFTAILSVASCKDTWNLFKSATDDNILFLSVSEANCPRLPSDSAVMVPIILNGDELPQLLLDLKSANALDWKSATILHDKTLEQDMATKFVKSLSQFSDPSGHKGISVTLLKLGNFTNDMDQRKSVTNMLSHLNFKQIGYNFIVISLYEFVKPILDAAQALGLVNPSSKWLYIISHVKKNKDDINEFRNVLREGDNVAFIYNISTNSTKCKYGAECHSRELLKAFVITLENAILDEITLSSQVSEEEWEAIRPTKSERKDFLLKGIKSYLSEFGDCGNCSKWRMRAGDTWGTTFLQNYTQELLQVGYWRPTDGVTLTDQLFPHVAYKFRGRTLPIVTYHDPPWQILTTNDSGTVLEYRGLTFDILRELSKRLNFTYTINMPKMDKIISNESDFQMPVSKSLPNEAIEMVRSREVLLGACGLTITLQRKAIINFTEPISIQTHTLLVARPKQLSRALLFISPFTYDTWLCLSLAVVGMGPILYFINRCSPAYEYNGKKVRGLESIQNCMWYMYGALLQQGGMYLPEVDSARLIIGTWWLVVLVVVTTYCGNLVAFLTFPKIDIPIRTLSDLIELKDSVTWGTLRGTYLEQSFRESDEASYKMISERMILYDSITPEIISQILARRHVLLAWKTKIAFIMKNHFIETGHCELIFGTDEFINEKIALFLAHDSPYLEMINAEIFRLHQVGLIGKWLQGYLPKRDRCWKTSDVSEVTNHTVNIDDMQGCFFVLFLGFVLSLTLIVVEKVYNRIKLKKLHTVVRPFVA